MSVEITTGKIGSSLL